MTLSKDGRARFKTALETDPIEALEAIVASHRSSSPGSSLALTNALRQLGNGHLQARSERAALDAWAEAAAVLRAQSPDAGIRQAHTDILIDVGALYCSLREGGSALPFLLEAAALIRAEEQSTVRRVWALNLLATAYLLTKQRKDGLAALREAEIEAHAVAQQSQSSRDVGTWALILNNIARVELTLARPQDACATLERCLHITRPLIDHSPDANNLMLHSATINKYGRALERTGKLAAALPLYRDASDILHGLVADGRDDLVPELHEVQADCKRLERKLAAAS